MSPARLLTVLGTALLVSPLLAAPPARPLREAASDNGRWRLDIEPGRSTGKRGCVATLAERDGGRERRRWSRPLVNDVAPVQAFVRDDGKFVVTLDDYPRGGLRNALVIYDERGRLVRHFLITDLLEAGDWRNVRAQRRAIAWLDGAVAAFDDEQQQFYVDLAWGRRITIDLKRLRIVRAPGERSAEGDALPPEIEALFEADSQEAESEGAEGDEPTDEPTGLDALDMGDDPVLKQEVTIVLPDGTKIVAGSELLDAHGQPIVTEAPQSDSPSEDGTASADKRPEPEQPEAAPEAVAAEAQADTAAAADANPAGVTVPPPNPAARVDYVAWLNEMGKVNGPDARPVYDQAIAQFQPFEGDEELFRRALEGDAEALRSPEIVNWLNRNEDAITNFHAAASLPARGWELHSESGRMLEVLLPHLSPMRGLARTTVLRGRAAAAEGDFATAADLYTTTYSAAAHTGDGPTLIENLVGQAMGKISSDALMDLMADAPAGAVDYAALAAKLETTARPVKPMPEAMQAERAFMYDTVQRLFVTDPATGKTSVDRAEIAAIAAVSGGESPPIDYASLEAKGFDGVFAETAASYDALAQAMQLPAAQAREVLGQFEQNVATAPPNDLIRVMMPALSRANAMSARSEATRRATLLVANLKAYEQQHGTLPDSLDAFGGREFTLDPFTGQPFAFHRDGGAFTLYSLGLNGADDGGVHDAQMRENDYVLWPRQK